MIGVPPSDLGGDQDRVMELAVVSDTVGALGELGTSDKELVIKFSIKKLNKIYCKKN